MTEEPRKLNDGQRAAFEKISAFLSRTAPDCFTLQGLAGTGKTELLGHVACAFPSVQLCAPTGKAASVLGHKVAQVAARLGKLKQIREMELPKTVHSLFYIFVGEIEDEDGRKRPVFKKRQPGSLSGTVVLVDEVSMVTDTMREDMLALGVRIIAVGDRGQLPPVKGLPGFPDADMELTEIVRQAADSPIIRQAHGVRHTGEYAADGPAFRVQKGLGTGALMRADMVLCWTNDTKRSVNQKIRSLRGYPVSDYGVAGEPVICLKNAPEYGVYNGDICLLAKDYDPKKKHIVIRRPGGERLIKDADFCETDGERGDECGTAFSFAYCLTVHKAQGSEWDKVLLLDEHTGADRRKWLYTGITRAAERILVCQL